jgi:hypothetical protein
VSATSVGGELLRPLVGVGSRVWRGLGQVERMETAATPGAP